MCGSDNNNIPRAFNSVYGLNLEEIFNPKAPGEDEFRIPPPQRCCQCPSEEICKGLAKNTAIMSTETRAELTSKVRDLRQRRRENEEANIVKPNIAYAANFKQPAKNQLKEFFASRCKNKDKRKQNYAFSRRE